MTLLDELFGPLATLECRRAVRPRWVLWVRLLVALPACMVVLVVAWVWILLRQVDPAFLPHPILAGGLLAIEMVELFLALLLSPALIAGAIAGEKDRGTLGMLLASQLSPREIILGRLAGCFSQVAMLAATGAVPLVFLAALCGLDPDQILLLTMLPAAVACGSAGLTVAASTLARRGRDALWTVYVIEILLLAAAVFGASRFAWLEWFRVLSPFATLRPLIYQADLVVPIASILSWLGIGLLGTVVAVRQLRPAFLRQTGGDVRGRGMQRRAIPLRDRPMLWKEFYFERTGSFGAFGRWLTYLLVAVLLGGGALVLGGVAWRWLSGASDIPFWCERISIAISYSSGLLLWLAQWMIGLRAVGVIASERQRSTWDAILASPLEAKEIVVAKACGSLFAMRWLLAALLVAWTATLAAGGMSIAYYVGCVTILAAGGALMLIVGIWIGTATNAGGSTRGMAVVIGLWMAATVLSMVLAFVLSTSFLLIAAVVWVTVVLATSPPDAVVDFVGSYVKEFWLAAQITFRVALYAATTAALGTWLTANFDRLAGRMGSWSITQRVKRSLGSLLDLPLAETEAADREA